MKKKGSLKTAFLIIVTMGLLVGIVPLRAKESNIFVLGDGGYIPESCRSSTSCMPEYTDRVMPFSGNTYCCSKNEQGVTGKAKQ